MTHQQQLRVAQARRKFSRSAASLKLTIAKIDQNQPFDQAIFEREVEHVVEALRELVWVEDQARNESAA